MNISGRFKKKLIARDGLVCFYCGKKCDEDEIHLDHIIPKCRGGAKYDIDNLVIACCRCNILKGTKTPKEFLSKCLQRQQEFKDELRYYNAVAKYLTIQLSEDIVVGKMQSGEMVLRHPFISISIGKGKSKSIGNRGIVKGDGFDIFWSSYPKKQCKGKCIEWWIKNKPTKKRLGKMLLTIEAFNVSDQWLREKGKYIPMPITWLNQGRWDDEPPEPMKQEKTIGEKLAEFKKSEEEIICNEQKQKNLSKKV